MGQLFFQVGQSGMNSLLAPGLHPFSPHFSPQKSGKPETFSVKLQTVENLREFCPSTHLFGRSIGASLCTDPSAHYGRWPLPEAGIKVPMTAILLIALLCTLSKNLLCQLSPPLKETKTRSVWQRKNVLNIKLIRLQSMLCTFEVVFADTHHSQLNRPSL